MCESPKPESKAKAARTKAKPKSESEMKAKGCLFGIAMWALSAGAAAPGSINVVSWGGVYEKSQVEAYHKPWMKKTGNRAVSRDYNGGLGEIRSQVQSGNVAWDVVDVEYSEAARGCEEGLLERIDHRILPPAPDGTPAAVDFIEGGLPECAVANIVWSTIFTYDRTKARGVGGIEDFFDLGKFPGKRGIRNTPKVNLEMALIADGVPPSEVYAELSTPEGVDRAFRKLDTIRDEVVLWEAGTDPPKMLADGKVVMSTAYNGTMFSMIRDEGMPFEINWDGQVLDMDFWVIPKGTRNKSLALDFISFATSTRPLAEQAKWIAYAPARKSSTPLLGLYGDGKTPLAPNMPTAPGNFTNGVLNDYQFWADNHDELSERFSRWLGN